MLQSILYFQTFYRESSGCLVWGYAREALSSRQTPEPERSYGLWSPNNHHRPRLSRASDGRCRWRLWAPKSLRIL